MTKLNKNDLVTYRTAQGGTFEARVIGRRKNGWVEIQTTFQINGYGDRVGPYLGHNYNIPASRLTKVELVQGAVEHPAFAWPR